MESVWSGDRCLTPRALHPVLGATGPPRQPLPPRALALLQRPAPWGLQPRLAPAVPLGASFWLGTPDSRAEADPGLPCVLVFLAMSLGPCPPLHPPHRPQVTARPWASLSSSVRWVQ